MFTGRSAEFAWSYRRRSSLEHRNEALILRAVNQRPRPLYAQLSSPLFSPLFVASGFFFKFKLLSPRFFFPPPKTSRESVFGFNFDTSTLCRKGSSGQAPITRYVLDVFFLSEKYSLYCDLSIIKNIKLFVSLEGSSFRKFKNFLSVFWDENMKINITYFF